MTGVRFREDTGFEGRCDYCLSWWPLDREFWYPVHGMRRCRACLSDLQRRKNAVRRSDPEVRAADVASVRMKRHANREQHLERRRAYYRKNRAAICAKRRAEYAKACEPARRRQYKREWMRAYRERTRALSEEVAA
jgi:predicted RNase H-like nuclease